MAIHQLCFVPSPCLRQASEPVTEFDEPLKALVRDMFETMYPANGCGLAAPQIGINKMISVIDHKGDETEQLVIINPEITQYGEMHLMEEGCLSVPGTYDKVPRAESVTVKAQDIEGKTFEINANGRLAHILQHEIDHLNGIVYLDKLSSFKRQRHMKKVAKYLKNHGGE